MTWSLGAKLLAVKQYSYNFKIPLWNTTTWWQVVSFGWLPVYVVTNWCIIPSWKNVNSSRPTLSHQGTTQYQSMQPFYRESFEYWRCNLIFCSLPQLSWHRLQNSFQWTPEMTKLRVNGYYTTRSSWGKVFVNNVYLGQFGKWADCSWWRMML